MSLALSYVAVAAVSFAVTFKVNRLLRLIDRPRHPWASSPWASMGPAMLSSLGSLVVWRYWGTIVWAALLLAVALTGWGLARLRKSIEEIPKRPLGL